MSRGLEIWLDSNIRRVLTIYQFSFEKAYEKKNRSSSDAEMLEATEDYCRLIVDKYPQLLKMIAARIGVYLNRYKIHANKSVDEYKLIYYIGDSLNMMLNEYGFDHLSGPHQYAMIGLLDDKLMELGINKEVMCKALLLLIDSNQLKNELGENGCYLLFKCVSTTAPLTVSDTHVVAG